MKAWHRQNSIFTYSSLSFSELPSIAKKTLRERGLVSLLNSFESSSGPNCFAAVAAAVCQGNRPDISKHWLHWKPLEHFLRNLGYKKKADSPQPADVLVFVKNESAFHAALYLGDGLYFEKPGQDFYEPYRVSPLKLWRSEWKGCQLQVWKKS